MGKIKKTVNFGGITLTIEVDEPCQKTPVRRATSCGCGSAAPAWGYGYPQAPVAPQSKRVEGIMVAVDKPQREDYECGWWGQDAFERDNRKFDNLVKAAKAITWKNKTPEGLWPVPQTHGGLVTGRPEPCRPSVAAPAPCRCSEPRREVRQKCGIPPIGAKVVAHYWNEPVFDR